jgi:hypothetical protein
MRGKHLTSSAVKGVTPPAVIISLGYFLIDLSKYVGFSIPDNIILNGVVLGYGLFVGIKHWKEKG